VLYDSGRKRRGRGELNGIARNKGRGCIGGVVQIEGLKV